MAIQLQPSETRIWNIVQAIIQLVNGRQNSVGDVTLTPSATSTVVSFVNCSSSCKVFLQPQTANAVAAQAMVADADIEQGTFTIRHLSAGAGSKLSFICVGG
jgi:hypothetical protein